MGQNKGVERQNGTLMSQRQEKVCEEGGEGVGTTSRTKALEKERSDVVV